MFIVGINCEKGIKNNKELIGASVNLCNIFLFIFFYCTVTISMASIMVFWSLLICTVNLSYCDRFPARYTINLDLAPEHRWDKVIDDHKELLPAVIEEIQ